MKSGRLCGHSIRSEENNTGWIFSFGTQEAGLISMAKNCIKCGKKLGFFDSGNEIIAGTGRFWCDKCFRPVRSSINRLRNTDDVEEIVEARIKAKNALKRAVFTQPVKIDVIQDIDTIYKKRCEELQLGAADIENAEKNIKEAEKARKEAESIIEINEGSWAFFTNLDAPDFAEKYDALLRAYLHNALLMEKRSPYAQGIEHKEKLYFIKWLVQQENWLYHYPNYLSARSKDVFQGIIVDNEDIRFKVIRYKDIIYRFKDIRFFCFLDLTNAINMYTDYLDYFGNSDVSEELYYKAYKALLEPQVKAAIANYPKYFKNKYFKEYSD